MKQTHMFGRIYPFRSCQPLQPGQHHQQNGRNGGYVSFNDALNTFYLWLYGVRHMVKDHSDSERGILLLTHGLLFPISSKGSFICTIPDRIAHTMTFVTLVVEHWLERQIAQWVHPMKDRSDDPSYHERMLLTRSYISLLNRMEAMQKLTPLTDHQDNSMTILKCVY